mgnify:CR=1 FL=1
MIRAIESWRFAFGGSSIRSGVLLVTIKSTQRRLTNPSIGCSAWGSANQRLARRWEVSQGGKVGYTRDQADRAVHNREHQIKLESKRLQWGDSPQAT